MPPQSKPRPKPAKRPPAAPAHRLAGLRFHAGGYVLDAATGLFYRLTPAADYLLRQYDAGTEVRDFAELIEARYGLDHASARRDVELLLNQFAGAGLLRDDRRKAAA